MLGTLGEAPPPPPPRQHWPSVPPPPPMPLAPRQGEHEPAWDSWQEDLAAEAAPSAPSGSALARENAWGAVREEPNEADPLHWDDAAGCWVEEPGVAACDVDADQTYWFPEKDATDQYHIKAMTVEYWELTGRARTLRGQLKSMGADPQDAGKDMQQPKNRGGVHAKAETILHMVRAGDFDALQEDAACAPGVFVDVWNQSSPWPPLPCSFIALIGNRAIGLKPKNGEDGLL